MVILADEPTGNLDPTQARGILELFREIHTHGTTIVLATHDSNLVDSLQTRVVRLENGTVIRDSVGGYDEEAPRRTKAAAQNGDDVTAVAKKSTKKVRITSIGS
jgi:cell division transport system ATP-binding protein